MLDLFHTRHSERLSVASLRPTRRSNTEDYLSKWQGIRFVLIEPLGSGVWNKLDLYLHTLVWQLGEVFGYGKIEHV
jgi:hypothetical protein